MSRPPASAAGIVEKDGGERIIAGSRRPDGSLRKEIRIRPGYVPPEDVARYKNEKVEAKKLPPGYVVGLGVVEKNKSRDGTAGGVPAQDHEKSKAAKKNEKRRAKKLEGQLDLDEDPVPEGPKAEKPPAPAPTDGTANGANTGPADEQKQIRNLKKKLGQAKELEAKKVAGETLLPEQEAKIAKMAELEDEINALEKRISEVKV